jgi:hypothetical protein
MELDALSPAVVMGYLIGALICGLIGIAIGNTKYRGTAGFWLGALLGPIGWILVAVGPDYSPAAKAATVEPRSAADRLDEIKQLLDGNLITAEEFEEKRREILADV